ncbi:TetR/AcrR family transcriptional regulator [Luteipulveratus sp. YIM 133132]|uniref:TetR/AcrR family transcriptional regulator n=1 Tax=Luteipulveratus flavus TaxID=3031728 RepID=A0ABT6C564_9MICO|nr:MULTISPECIES: TetR/AcrR family transcriptional regulator [unclassified Luteipulveratus]MDE9367776.1 TetR/AcrR family transcriptional regulator [Luteipulveratus sp. YIM 133132]MDF8263698.1 TetR/AcrR family transcriptional regulator [Luteipulveratus sp. YIM 133296]
MTGTAARPRIAGDREDAVLDGVLEALVEVGYDKLTFDLVAARVRAGKATLYRRWPTKADLVVAAVSQVKVCPDNDLDRLDTGSLRGDLEALTCGDAEATELLPSVMAAIVAAVHRDDDLRTQVEEQIIRPRYELLLAAFERAQQRGEIGPDADLALLASVIPAMAIRHSVELGTGPTTEHMRRVVEQVLLPACAATLPTPDPQQSATTTG